MIFPPPVLCEFSDLDEPTHPIIDDRDRTGFGTGHNSVAAKMNRYDGSGEKTAQVIPSSELVEHVGIGHGSRFETFERFSEAPWTFCRGKRINSSTLASNR